MKGSESEQILIEFFPQRFFSLSFFYRKEFGPLLDVKGIYFLKFISRSAKSGMTSNGQKVEVWGAWPLTKSRLGDR